MVSYDDDDPRRLRVDDDARDGTASQVGPGDDLAPNSPAWVGYATENISAATYGSIQPVRVSGTETDGGAATFTLVGSAVECLNIGGSTLTAGSSGTMSTNTYVLVTWVADRWIFQYG